MKAYIPNNPSSNIYRVTHSNVDKPDESKEGNLIVGMKGGTYVYSGVPIEHMVEMLRAESAGKYLNSVIKGKYDYRLATEEEIRSMHESEPGVMSDFEHARLFPNSDEARDQDLIETIDAKLLDANLIRPPYNNWPQIIDIKFLDPEVKVKYAKIGDAAFDLMASRASDATTNTDLEFPVFVLPGQHVLIGTGLAMKLSRDLAGLVVPRSGLAKKNQIGVVNSPGLIDSGYTGEIGVLFENRGNAVFKIEQYDRIAQYLIAPVITPVFRVVADLEQTERGSACFGSTGVAAEVKVDV